MQDSAYMCAPEYIQNTQCPKVTLSVLCKIALYKIPRSSDIAVLWEKAQFRLLF